MTLGLVIVIQGIFMVEDARPANASAAPRAAVGFLGGLSGKLLLLTVAFVMLAEVLIFVPSVANMRIRWLQDRLNTVAAAAVVVDGLQNVELPAPCSARR